LYSELGASEDIVKGVEERLDRHIQKIRAEGETQEFLLSDKLRPALLQKSDRLGEIRANIQRRILRLQDKSDDGRGKQKLLDIADNANAEVEQNVSDVPTGSEPKKGASAAELEGLLRDWRVANVLLGAAAQSLPGATKQRLSALLVVGGAAIADRLTRLYAAVDFQVVKAKAMSSNEVDAFLSAYSSGIDKEQLRQLVGYLIDFVELYVLALPFRTVLNDLCDQSGDKVLSGSVDRAIVPEGLASLLHSTWLLDLDSKKAMRRLRKQLSKIPLPPFLRITLAHHFLSRVYWRHWNEVDRSQGLEAAAETIKAFGAMLRKDELGRWIGKTIDVETGCHARCATLTFRNVRIPASMKMQRKKFTRPPL
jgi:hypothetical protein